jgi:hypothetical protein
MTESSLVHLTFQEAETLWAEWAPDADDLLARAAFDRTLRWAIGLEDEGLYFRPGGWAVDLPATVARVALAAAVLAAGFQIAGLEDLDREIIISIAGLVSAMGVRPVKLTASELLLVERIRDAGLADVPLAPKQARKALPRRVRDHVTREEVEDALARLVAAGVADRAGPSEYVVRGAGDDAWIRVSLS